MCHGTGLAATSSSLGPEDEKKNNLPKTCASELKRLSKGLEPNRMAMLMKEVLDDKVETVIVSYITVDSPRARTTSAQ